MALMLRKNLNVRTGLTSQSNTPIVEIEQPAMLEQLENSTVYNPAVEGSKDSAQIERESASFDADEDHLTAETGLSDETLQLLLQFQSLGCRFADDINDGTKDVITSKTVCVSYTARDSQVIAETYRRLQEKAENAAQDYASQLESRVIQDLQGFDCINSCAPQRLKEDMFGALQRDGVVRLNHVLDADSCERCLESINRSLEEVDSSDTIGFGNVFSRKCRYDMYLRPQGVYREALQTLLSSKHSALGALLDRCLSVSNQGEAHIGQNVPCNFGRFHELSTLIADPGAAPQPIHPDSGYAPHAPMWTCFVALQDISPEMGPTVFLPGTHTETSHALLKDPARKDAFLSGCTYKQGLLRAGDVAVMDARTLHFGNANESKHRRTLFYFTIRNPAHGSDPSDFPPCGSLFEDVEGLTIESLRNENGGKLLLDKQ